LLHNQFFFKVLCFGTYVGIVSYQTCSHNQNTFTFQHTEVLQAGCLFKSMTLHFQKQASGNQVMVV